VHDLLLQVAPGPFDEGKGDASLDIELGQGILSDAVLDEEGVEAEPLDADPSIR